MSVNSDTQINPDTKLYKINLQLSLVFLVIDCIIYFSFIFYFGIKKHLNLNITLTFIFGLDFISCLSNIFFLYLSNILLKEVVISIITTFQIILIISFFDQLFSNKKINISAKYIKIKNKLLLLFFIVFVFIFHYDPHSSYKLFYEFCFTMNMFFLFFLYKYISKHIKLYLLQIKKISNRKKINYYLIKNLIVIFPNLSTIIFIEYYSLKMLCLLYYNSKFYKYLSIIRIILKEVGKDLCFIFLIVIYYSFEKKINKSKNKKEQNDTNTVDEIKIGKNSEDIDNSNIKI